MNSIVPNYKDCEHYPKQDVDFCESCKQFSKFNRAENDIPVGSVLDVVVNEFEKAIDHLSRASVELINHNQFKNHEFTNEIHKVIGDLVVTVKYLKSK